MSQYDIEHDTTAEVADETVDHAVEEASPESPEQDDVQASAAEPVMGKLDRVPAAIVRGLPLPPDDGSGSKSLLRDPARDLFR